MRLLPIAFFLISALPAFSTSFDCRAATHPSDITICSVEALSTLEMQYVEAYQSLLAMGGETADVARNVAARQMAERRRCNGNANCIWNALNRAMDEYWVAWEMDAGDSDRSGDAASRSWKSLENVPTETLIQTYENLEDECRGGTTMLAVDRCDERNEIFEYLKRMRGLCFGHEDQFVPDYEWHECRPGSH